MATDRRDARQLIHEYFGVDLALVWDVVERELAPLLAQLQDLSERLGAETGTPERDERRTT